MTKHYEVFYDRYNPEGTEVIGRGYQVVRGSTEEEARMNFIKMLPLGGEWMLKIDFMIECDVWWDHIDENNHKP
jgi:hypothetical protein